MRRGPVADLMRPCRTHDESARSCNLLAVHGFCGKDRRQAALSSSIFALLLRFAFTARDVAGGLGEANAKSRTATMSGFG